MRICGTHSQINSVEIRLPEAKDVMQDKFELNILTPFNLMKREHGRIILETFCRDCPQAAPQVYGNYEPLRTRFHCEDISEALQSWNRNFLWKNRKSKVEGSVWMAWAPKPKHGWIACAVNSTTAPQQLMQLFIKLSTDFRAHFACYHYLTDADIQNGEANGTVTCLNPARHTYNLSVTGHHLRKYIPDIYWHTLFGKPYIEHFGRERLMTAPAYRVQALGDDAILLELAPDAAELRDHPEEIAAQKNAVKAHLGWESFFQIDKGKDYPYSVPTFHVEGPPPGGA